VKRHGTLRKKKHALIPSSVEQTEHVLTALNGVTLHLLLRFFNVGVDFAKIYFLKSNYKMSNNK
jgi:hypothetical protein